MERRNHVFRIIRDKIVELQDRKKILIATIGSLQKDKDKQLNEMSETLYSEKELLRGKISDIEKGTSDAEHKRFVMLLGNEKERVKWE